jgi:hypothetical protein
MRAAPPDRISRSKFRRPDLAKELVPLPREPMLPPPLAKKLLTRKKKRRLMGKKRRLSDMLLLDVVQAY